MRAHHGVCAESVNGLGKTSWGRGLCLFGTGPSLGVVGSLVHR